MATKEELQAEADAEIEAAKPINKSVDGVKMRCAATPANEFNSNDELLVGAFPSTFLLGKAYGRSSGNLSVAQRNHLLKKFTQVTARNKRLLGYLADVIRRFEVISGVMSFLALWSRSHTQIAILDPSFPHKRGCSFCSL